MVRATGPRLTFVSTAAAVAATVATRRVRGVFASVATHRDYWQERAQADGDLLYVALGDSTAQAVGARQPQDGYVGRLAADLERSSGRTVRVVNLSVSGARAADAVQEQLPRLRELLADGAEPALVTVSIGANDTGRTRVEDFEASMRQIVDALPAGARVADVPYFRGPRNADALAFSDVIRRLVAARGDLVQADLWVRTGGMRPHEYAADLFHPNARGYDRYYRAFTGR